MMSQVLLPGDHLRVFRGAYAHHGVYVGGGNVIHFTSVTEKIRDAAIRGDSLEAFLDGGLLDIVRYADADPAEKVIRRARSRLGQNGYRLFSNNCEHFARWCKTGEHRSEQVTRATAGAAAIGGGATLTSAAIGVVSASGAVAGLGGPGVMSGLAAVGGTAVGGLIGVGAGPGALATAAMHRAFRDDAALPASEREARRAGRVASTVGAVGGAVGSIAAVSAAGSVAGLSAAGITSGLAAIGSVVGGGMVAGVTVVAAVPALAAIAVGLLFYRGRRKKI